MFRAHRLRGDAGGAEAVQEAGPGLSHLQPDEAEGEDMATEEEVIIEEEDMAIEEDDIAIEDENTDNMRAEEQVEKVSVWSGNNARAREGRLPGQPGIVVVSGVWCRLNLNSVDESEEAVVGTPEEAEAVVETPEGAGAVVAKRCRCQTICLAKNRLEEGEIRIERGLSRQDTGKTY